MSYLVGTRKHESCGFPLFFSSQTAPKVGYTEHTATCHVHVFRWFLLAGQDTPEAESKPKEPLGCMGTCEKWVKSDARSGKKWVWHKIKDLELAL